MEGVVSCLTPPLLLNSSLLYARYMLCDIEVGPQLALDVRQNIKKLTDVIRVSMVVK